MQYSPNDLQQFWNSLPQGVERLLEERRYLHPHVFEDSPPPVRFCATPPIEFEHLRNRWVTPLRFPNGELCTFIGWSGTAGMKYMTLTYDGGVAKKNLLFGADVAWKISRELVIVVEGIFDCLALQALGLPCVSVMGASPSYAQSVQLKQWSRSLGIPDHDAPRMVALDKWGTDHYLTWSGRYSCKDCDDLVNLFGLDLLPVFAKIDYMTPKVLRLE